MKKLILALFILLPLTVSAAPSYTLMRSILPETTNTYDLGSTSPNKVWKNVFTNNLYATTSIVDTLNLASTTATSTISGNLWIKQNLQVDGIAAMPASLSLNNFTPGSVLFVGAGGTIAQNNANFFIDNANTRLGIGTTSPWNKLDVNGNVYFSGTGFFGGAITGTSTLNITGLTTLVNASTTQLTTTGSTYLATTNGNVGIGTTAPGYLLDVNGVAHAATSFTVGTNPASAGAIRLPNATAINARTAANGADINLIGSDGSNNVIVGTVSGGLTLTAGGITNFSAGDDITFTQNSVVPFTSVKTGAVANTLYLNSGNVGIGTTSPQVKLQVAGNTPSIRIDSSTVDTAGTLDFYDSTRGQINGSLSGSPNGTNPFITLTRGAAGAGSDFIRMAADNSIQFATNNAEKMRIISSGNVGIGTTSPWGKLSITGTGQTTGVAFLVADSANSPKVTILDSGNVGIGTTGPTQKLDVNGNVNIENANGIILKDTTLGTCGIVNLTGGLLVVTAHACQ